MQPRPRTKPSNSDRPRKMGIIFAALMIATLVLVPALAAANSTVFLAAADSGVDAVTIILIVIATIGLALVIMWAAGNHGKGAPGQRARTLGIIGIVAMLIGGLGLIAPHLSVSGNVDASTAPAATSVTGNLLAKAVNEIIVVKDELTPTAAMNGALVNAYLNGSTQHATYTRQQAFQQTPQADNACTTPSDGTNKCTLQTTQAGTYDICVSMTGYYPRCASGDTTSSTQPYDANHPTPDVQGKIILLKKVGVISTATQPTTISSSGCTAGTSTCPLTISIGGPLSGTWLNSLAVKLVPVVSSSSTTALNLTYSSLASGSTCSAATINGATYIWDANRQFLAVSNYLQCGVNLAFGPSGATDGKINLVADDGFIPQLYAAMASPGPGIPTGDFETNVNWATVSSAAGAAAATVSVTR